jgi:hypothetical protein
MAASGVDLRVQPYRVAPETWVIPQLLEAPPIGLAYWSVDEAFELIRRIPQLPRWHEPGQDDLEAMLAAAGALATVAVQEGAP